MKQCLPLLIILCVAALTNTCPAQAVDNPETATNGIMPTLPQLIELIDKASTGDSPNAPADWSTPVKLVAIFTLLALLPSVLAMTTSFTRITIVMGFVRRALGTQTIPPNIAMMGLALFLTLYTMAPTFYKMNDTAIQPYLDGTIDSTQATVTASNIIKEFMLRQTRQTDLARFIAMAKIEPPDSVVDLPLHIVIPSFIISEFRTAFEIGCLIFIPFLLLDLVIASVLLTAGMMMLPPVMISLPFKIILFILIDGWGILAQSLSLSFR